MLMRVKLQTLALLALGAALGCVIAVSGGLRPRAATAADTAAADLNAALAQRNQEVTARAAASGKKPNILVIWGDDIGQSNISAYTFGLVGYRTPNIDRIAREGMMFTDYYGEQSCTAGRSAFILGQSVFRSGLSKVGLPGAELGIKPHDPTIAAMLRRRATRPASSARTISAIATSTSRPTTGSTSFSATSTTSTPRKSPRTRTTRRTPRFGSGLARGA
jgi:arylsulfatase